MTDLLHVATARISYAGCRRRRVIGGVAVVSIVEGTRAAYDWSGCPAPTEHAEFDRIRELVREVPGVTLADCVAVLVRERDEARAHLTAWLARSGLEGQEAGNRPPACLDCTDTCTCSSAGCASCPCHGGPAEILRRLCHGGRVVSTAELHAAEIVVARAEGRLWVDEDGCGYVYLSPETP